MLNCENCNLEHNGMYASGRFCSSKCAHGFSSKEKRLLINAKVSKSLTGRGNPKVIKKCLECGIEFETTYKLRNKNLCSMKCAGKHKKISPDGIHPVVAFRQRNKIKAIEYKGGKCIICGYCKAIRSMQFHHMDPDKKDFGIGGNGSSFKWETVKLELDKCILVCANCHGEIHEGILDINKYVH
jgi:hypothetical protein